MTEKQQALLGALVIIGAALLAVMWIVNHL
jgi:hypothetical protein